MKQNSGMARMILLAVIASIMAGAEHAESGFYPEPLPRTSTEQGVYAHYSLGPGTFQPVLAPSRGFVPRPAWVPTAAGFHGGWSPSTAAEFRARIVPPLPMIRVPMPRAPWPEPTFDTYPSGSGPWPYQYVHVGPRDPTAALVPSPQPYRQRPLALPMSQAETQALRALR